MSPFFVFLLYFIFLLFFFSLPYPLLSLPNPDPVQVQQPFLPSLSPPSTIPAFPEQSDLTTCPLQLPPELFRALSTACAPAKTLNPLYRTRCCPVLAAWFYYAYSTTALRAAPVVSRASPYEMPLLPDDSETCVDGLGKALREKGIELMRPNESCDLMNCYCGIRLHRLSCSDAFSVDKRGKLVGDWKVKRLEKDCLSDENRFPGLGGCSKCLNTLYLLNQKKSLNSSKAEERSTKIHNKDCQLMGLTWLLAKSRTAYIHTVTAVLRAIMMNPSDSSNPQSCTLNSDGKPLAVDSSELSDQSSSPTPQPSILVLVISVCLSYMQLALTSFKFS